MNTANFGLGADFNEFQHTQDVIFDVAGNGFVICTNAHKDLKAPFQLLERINPYTELNNQAYREYAGDTQKRYFEQFQIEDNTMTTSAPTMPKYFYRGELIAYPENIIVRDVTIKACMTRLQEFARVLELPAIMQIKNIRHDEIVYSSLGFKDHA